MLTSSFIFAKGMTEELERTLWAHGLTSWELLKKHPEEATELIGASRSMRLLEAVNEASQALLTRDLNWFLHSWPEREMWRLWQGFCPLEKVALVDIETTGLTPGYDQITVIGLADQQQARAFVAGRPQAGDETLDAFRLAIRSYDLLVTFNGASFDVPFIVKHFRDASFHFEQPHLDLLPLARSLGLSGGLKDMEKQVGITRGDDIKNIRGMEAIQLWGAWKGGDAAAYRKLTTYCKADCTNLMDFAKLLYDRKWQKVHVAHAKSVNFTAIKGQQLSLF